MRFCDPERGASREEYEPEIYVSRMTKRGVNISTGWVGRQCLDALNT